MLIITDKSPRFGTQKPRAWGSLSQVQSGVYRNAASIGIDPTKILLLLPTWEGAGNLLDTQGFVGVPNSGTAWTNTGIANVSAGAKTTVAGVSSLFNNLSELSIITTVTANSQGIGTEYGKILASPSELKAKIEFGNTSGRLYATIASESCGGSYNYTSDLYGQLVNVVATYKAGETNGLKLWVNGVNTDSSTSSNLVWDTGDLTIGNRLDGARPWDGEISFTAIINQALSGEQVSTLNDSPYLLLTQPPTVTYFDTAPLSVRSPLNNATGVATSVPFVWDSVVGATQYQLQVASTQPLLEADTPDEHDSVITAPATSKTVSLSGGSDHWWRVRADV